MDDNTLNWGILGCANIARKNCRAIALSKGNVLRAIASRSLATAEAFLRENNLDPGVTKVYGSYEDLLNDPDIQAVYIPLPTMFHLEWALKTAVAKKHILIEKPTAVTLATLKAILAACEENNVIFMDGVMFMHHARMNILRKLLHDPFAGDVTHVNSSFSFNSSEDFLANNIRVKASNDPLGVLGDLGWYCIRLGLIAFSNGLDYAVYSDKNLMTAQSSKAYFPTKVSARCNVWNEEKVPIDMEATVWFASLMDRDMTNSRNAIRCLRFDASFLQPFRQTYEISLSSPVKGVGDKVIRCNDFVIPKSDNEAKLFVETQALDGPLINLAAHIASLEDELKTSVCCQEAEMFSAMAAYHAFRQGGTLPDVMPPESYWPQMSIWTQAVTDACLLSMQLEGSIVAINL